MSVIASSDEMLEVTTAAMVMPSHALDFTQISEEGLKKIRKPYTISKSRESWSEQEHEKFLEALQLFDRDWKKIEAFIGSKTVIQIRSHAQKYFLKVQKNGSGEHVPPPRPKRKSLQPYPQKASKCALLSQPVLSHGRLDSMQTDSLHSDSPQKGNVFVPSVSGTPAISAWSYDAVSPGSITVAPLDLKPSDLGRSVRGGSAEALGCREGTFFGHGPEKLQFTDQGNGEMQIRANPDFSKIYSFIGSVFDPSVKGHLKTLKDMAVIDCETIVLLMTNLAINLSSPDFEQNKLCSSAYGTNLSALRTEIPSGATEQASLPCTTEAPLDVTDAITSVSGHAGEAKIASPDLSDDVRMQQSIALEKSCKETLQQWGHPYDTGGGGGGGSCQSHSLLSASNEQPSDLQCCPLEIEDKFQNISDSNVDCFALDLQLLQSTNGADDMHTSWWA